MLIKVILGLSQVPKLYSGSTIKLHMVQNDISGQSFYGNWNHNYFYGRFKKIQI